MKARSIADLLLALMKLLALMTLLAGGAPAQAQPAAVRIVHVRGDVKFESGAGTQPAARDMRLNGGSLRTGVDGTVQFVWRDALLALSPGSELVLSGTTADAYKLELRSGGLRLDATGVPAGVRIELPGRSILTNGYLSLRFCDQGCALSPGLYGQIAQGEAVLEYQGGRSVLRNRSFVWTAGNARPEVMAKPAALFDVGDTQADAARARVEATDRLAAAQQAFRDGNDALARAKLEEVRLLTPGEPLVDYYLGLVALHQDDNAKALVHLQQYARQDPQGAAERDVNKTLTLLSSSQLQIEAATAVAREKEVASAAPEPNSIAVNAFVNHGDDNYRAMAKGLAAMIIADLSKVPGLKVLEREKVQLLVNEMKLGDSGLADSASAVRSGRLMRAEKIIVGEFEVK